MKKAALALLLCALLVTLTACRTRILSEPAPAAPSPTVSEPSEPVEPEPEPSEPPTPEEPDASEEPEPDVSNEPEPEPEPLPPNDPEPPEETRPELPDGITEAGTAVYEEKPALTLSVTYDPNGGQTPVLAAAVETGAPYGVQPEATRRGHAFLGWWTAPEGGERVTPETVVTETVSHTLYAHWEKRPASVVTLNGNGGRVKTRESKLELSDGDAYGPLPVPLREGYELLGWFTAPEGGSEITPETAFDGGDRTIYAQWRYDPYAYWSFVLRNRVQQMYFCQQASIYLETEDEGVTLTACPLITDTGSFNVAENRSDPHVTDDWVLAKKPGVVIKVTETLQDAGRPSLEERFPGVRTVFVTREALDGGASGLYAALALAKELYPDWYMDVDLSAAAQELGITEIPIEF